MARPNEEDGMLDTIVKCLSLVDLMTTRQLGYTTNLTPANPGDKSDLVVIKAVHSAPDKLLARTYVSSYSGVRDEEIERSAASMHLSPEHAVERGRKKGSN